MHSSLPIEYEATFFMEKDMARGRLSTFGATQMYEERLMKRAVFHLPIWHEQQGWYARVRDEGDKVTMSVKVINGQAITDQREVMVVVNDFESGRLLLTSLGCREKAYQETRREMWRLQDCEICIDEWPFLESFIEVEWPSEVSVKRMSELLGCEWSEAYFWAVAGLYEKKYGVSKKRINDETPRIVFDMENPFLGAHSVDSRSEAGMTKNEYAS